MAKFEGYGIGGGAYSAFYSITVGTTQTTLASTTPVYTCQAQISTDGAKDDAGVPTFTLDQIQTDSAFFTFVKTYAGVSTGVTPEDVPFEDGDTRLGSAATGTTLAAGFKGPKIAGGTDNGKTLSYFGLFKVAQNSGSINFSSGTYIKPNLVCIAQKLEKDLIIPQTVHALFATTGTSQTIGATTAPYGDVVFG